MFILSDNTNRKSGCLNILVIFAIISILAFNVFVVRMIIASIQEKAPPQTSINDYLTISEETFIIDNPYEIFPDKEVVLKTEEYDYFQKKVIEPLLLIFEDEAIIFLSCNYNEEQFAKEISRLDSLVEVSNTERFSLPAYEIHDFKCYEYALIDEDSNKIYYVLSQSESFLNEFLPDYLRPKLFFDTPKK